MRSRGIALYDKQYRVVGAALRGGPSWRLRIIEGSQHLSSTYVGGAGHFTSHLIFNGDKWGAHRVAPLQHGTLR
jgi:hypothetical protein